MPTTTTSKGLLELVVNDMGRVQDGVDALTEKCEEVRAEQGETRTRLALIESGSTLNKFIGPGLAIILGLGGSLVGYGAQGARLDAAEAAIKASAADDPNAAPRLDAIEHSLRSGDGRWTKRDQVEHERKTDARFERIWNRFQQANNGGR